jgi:hypothetical protein
MTQPIVLVFALLALVFLASFALLGLCRLPGLPTPGRAGLVAIAFYIFGKPWAVLYWGAIGVPGFGLDGDAARWSARLLAVGVTGFAVLALRAWMAWRTGTRRRDARAGAGTPARRPARTAVHGLPERAAGS